MNIASQLRRPFLSFNPDRERFRIPIAQRLTLGFLATALIASIVAGVIGLQRQATLYKESAFYTNLLQAKTTLTVGASYLELMDSQMHRVLDLLSEQPVTSPETLNTEEAAMTGLIMRYNKLLNSYIAADLLDKNADQAALLRESNHELLLIQQHALASSALRTWGVCQEVHQGILGALARKDLAPSQTATTLERLQGERTLADALSAIRALAQFNDLLSRTVLDGVSHEEQTQLLTTGAAILFVFIAIMLVGRLLISSPVVYRIKQLHNAMQGVEEGKAAQLFEVRGRDEIADISSSVNAMLEIIAAEEEIMTASELKDQFIASVSHELRNPLTEVFGWLELLNTYEGKLEPEMQAKFLGHAIHGCEELMHLINNVLDATQVGRRMKDPRLEAVAVRALVETVVEQLDPRDAEKYSLHTHLPPHLMVRADPHYVRQILRNLLSNALKYSPPYSRITVSATRSPHTDNQSCANICISVQDSGPGIPPAEIPRLFQKFARLQRDKARDVRGTGLGLYICKQLVESMHGQIWVESNGIAGEGSRFSFTLPEALPLSLPSTGDLMLKGEKTYA